GGPAHGCAHAEERPIGLPAMALRTQRGGGRDGADGERGHRTAHNEERFASADIVESWRDHAHRAAVKFLEAELEIPTAVADRPLERAHLEAAQDHAGGPAGHEVTHFMDESVEDNRGLKQQHADDESGIRQPLRVAPYAPI